MKIRKQFLSVNNVRSFSSFLLCFLNLKFIFLFASSILIFAAINTDNRGIILLIVLYIFPGYPCYPRLPSYPLNIRGLIVKLVVIVGKYPLLITDFQPIYKVPLIVRDNFVIFLVNEKRIKSLYAGRGISPIRCSTESTK